MRRRSIRRFALEVLFLAGVAAALTIADLRPAAVIVLMGLAWVIVALLEWTAWLDEPHYGRGLPPRYYVPHVALPPPRPIEQPHAGYPVFIEPDDAPTFVAETTQWAAALDQWPVTEDASEDTVIAVPEELAGRAVVPLPPPIPELEETVAAGVAVPEPPREEPAADLVLGVAAVEALAGSEPAEEAPHAPVVAPELAAEPLALEPRGETTALHHVDPLAASGRRRFWRRSADEDAVEVLDGPAPDRILPSRIRAGSGADVR